MMRLGSWSGAGLKTVFSSLLMMALVCMTGCQGGSGEKEATPSDAPRGELIRGLYLFGHETRALLPCGEEEDLWVIDNTGLLSDLHKDLVESLAGEIRIFVIATGSRESAPAEGFGAEYAGSVVVDEVIYAAREGYRCEFDLSGFSWRAYGTEPFWLVEITGDGMTYSTPGTQVLTWPEVSGEIIGDKIELRGKGGGQEGVLVILPGPGHDDMSGAYFHHRASFELDGKLFEGAAMRGQMSERIENK